MANGKEIVLEWKTMLKLDRRFFDAFFDSSPYYWEGFLSSKVETCRACFVQFIYR